MYPSFTSTNFPPFQLIPFPDGTIFNPLLQQHMPSDDHSNHNANNVAAHQQLASHDINTNGDDGFNNKPKGSSKRMIRASKSDRHSKIKTAQGLRDRRMRLSLEVSKKFFKLQDMLGFDKASKTVEWLLMKSKSNIQELIPHGDHSSFSSVPISETFSSKCELSSEYIDGDQNQKGKKKISRVVRKSSYLFRARETREMARKRARERTLEKSNKLACVISGGDDQFSLFRPCLDPTIERDANCCSSMIGGWNPSFLFDYHQTGLVHPQEHQYFNDFQIFGMRDHEFSQ